MYPEYFEFVFESDKKYWIGYEKNNIRSYSIRFHPYLKSELDILVLPKNPNVKSPPLFFLTKKNEKLK